MGNTSFCVTFSEAEIIRKSIIVTDLLISSQLVSHLFTPVVAQWQCVYLDCENIRVAVPPPSGYYGWIWISIFDYTCSCCSLVPAGTDTNIAISLRTYVVCTQMSVLSLHVTDPCTQMSVLSVLRYQDTIDIFLSVSYCHIISYQ